MPHPTENESDYGTGKKKLSIYVNGLFICSVLTLLAFGVVMKHALPKIEILIVIYAAAIIQFIVQLVCFLRLNTQTEQGKNNVMSLIFTVVILTVIILGSIWIMWNVNHNMMYM